MRFLPSCLYFFYCWKARNNNALAKTAYYYYYSTQHNRSRQAHHHHHHHHHQQQQQQQHYHYHSHFTSTSIPAFIPIGMERSYHHLLPTGMDFFSLRDSPNRWYVLPTTTTDATTKQHELQQQHHHPRRRRWRLRRRMVLAIHDDTATSDVTIQNNEPKAKATPYTIDQSVCPSTHNTVLEQLVTKHITNLPQYWKNKPTALHNEEAFEAALEFVVRFRQQVLLSKKNDDKNELDTRSSSDVFDDGKECASSSLSSLPLLQRTKVILDSGCGTGKSSHILGERFSDCVVIGIDRSLARLNRNQAYRHEMNGKHNNVLLLRADATDFWKLCLTSSQWQQYACIIKHYILYPNPYPKKTRLMNRYYAHPAFPLLMMTLTMNTDFPCDDSSEVLVVRSNWKTYLDEFRVASEVWIQSGGDFSDWNRFIKNVWDGDENPCWYPNTRSGSWTIQGPKQLFLDHDTLSSSTTPMTNFEAKFMMCGELVFELSIRRNTQAK